MSDRPDLDLIGMVQRARMAHDAEAKPSQVTSMYWIEAKSRVEGMHPPTERAGYWYLRTTLDAIDQQWQAIREATEAGKLGYKSKASGRGDSHERVIHVMTYDAGDAADVARVRAALRELGLAGAWEYKRTE